MSRAREVTGEPTVAGGDAAPKNTDAELNTAHSGRNSSPYLTTDEAAAYLRTTRGTVYNLVWRGVLPRRKGKLLFTRQELDNYLAGEPTTKTRRCTG